MTDAEWIAAFCARLGVPPPGAEEFDRVLKLAAEAAHASERTAAPLACWIAGRAGLGIEQAIAEAEAVRPADG